MKKPISKELQRLVVAIDALSEEELETVAGGRSWGWTPWGDVWQDLTHQDSDVPFEQPWNDDGSWG